MLLQGHGFAFRRFAISGIPSLYDKTGVYLFLKNRIYPLHHTNANFSYHANDTKQRNLQFSTWPINGLQLA